MLQWYEENCKLFELENETILSRCNIWLFAG